MRLQRKLKKRIIKSMGRVTYKGIISGYLEFQKYHKNKGIEVIYTKKKRGDEFGINWFHAHQYNPYLTFKNIKNFS